MSPYVPKIQQGVTVNATGVLIRDRGILPEPPSSLRASVSPPSVVGTWTLSSPS